MLKRQYSQAERERLARMGDAMPDGSFPIRNRADLQNAIQAVGRAANYDDAKRHIIRRAKELSLESMLPEEWTNPAKVQKVWGGTFIPRSWKA